MANYRFDDVVAPLPISGDVIRTHVYPSLRDEIIAGEQEPGYRMVRRRISDRLGVSHVPVTEALFKFEIHELVLQACRFWERLMSLPEVSVPFQPGANHV